MLKIENSIIHNKHCIQFFGNLSGIDALTFRNKIHSHIGVDSVDIYLDLLEISDIDLTGFNAIVMLKKVVSQRNKDLYIMAQDNNPVHEYIHLSKLSFKRMHINQI